MTTTTTVVVTPATGSTPAITTTTTVTTLPSNSSGIPAPVQLNPVQPDYYGIYSSLEADLIQTKSWTSLAPTSTGAALLRYMASIGAFNQGGVARALQENYVDTARSPSAVLRGVRLQGANPIRPRPGSVPVTVTRTDSLATILTVPAYTQWLVAGVPFFNRSPVVISSTGSSVSAVLYQGTVNTIQLNSSGLPYQRYVLGQSGGWDIGNDDLWMTDATGASWSFITTGLWRQSATSRAFFTSTLPDGRVECRFGDGTYAAVPPPGLVTFGYVSCLSAQDSTAQQVSSGSAVTVAGYTVSAITGGVTAPNQDAPPPEFYKAVGPGQAANNGRGVTRDDLRALALAYPGVVDALFRGQAETNPSDLRFMNVMWATLLTTSPWTQSQWLEFKRYMESQRAMATCVLARSDPTAVVVNPTVNVYALAVADLPSLKTIATNALTNLLSLGNTSLGWSMYDSDIKTAILENATYQQAPNESGALVDYITATPGHVVVGPTQYIQLGLPNINVLYSTRGLSAASTGEILGL